MGWLDLSFLVVLQGYGLFGDVFIDHGQLGLTVFEAVVACLNTFVLVPLTQLLLFHVMLMITHQTTLEYLRARENRTTESKVIIRTNSNKVQGAMKEAADNQESTRNIDGVSKRQI